MQLLLFIFTGPKCVWPEEARHAQDAPAFRIHQNKKGSIACHYCYYYYFVLGFLNPALLNHQATAQVLFKISKIFCCRWTGYFSSYLSVFTWCC